MNTIIRMKRLTLSILLFFFSALCWAPPAPNPPTPTPWVTMTMLACANTQVMIYENNAVYGSTNVNPNWGFQSNQWITTDLTPYGVPPTAKFAFLSGMLIITHGYADETANVTFTARIPGDLTANPIQYLGQTLEAQTGGGQRSNAAFWVPIKGGKIEWMYQTPDEPALYPSYSAYAVNFTLQCWGQ